MKGRRDLEEKRSGKQDKGERGEKKCYLVKLIKFSPLLSRKQMGCHEASGLYSPNFPFTGNIRLELQVKTSPQGNTDRPRLQDILQVSLPGPV